MQYLGDYVLSSEKLDNYIIEAIRYYESPINNLKINRLKECNHYLNISEYAVFSVLNAVDLRNYAINEFALMYSLSTYHDGNKASTFALFHQQLRDCLAAIFY